MTLSHQCGNGHWTVHWIVDVSNYKSEKQGGRMQCFMKKEDKSLIDVEYVEILISNNCDLFAALTSFLP